MTPPAKSEVTYACEETVSSSLHGLIISHAYGVPSAWVSSSVGRIHGDGSKYLDYFGSVGLDVGLAARIDAEKHRIVSDPGLEFLRPAVNINDLARALMAVCPFEAAKEAAQKPYTMAAV